MKNNYLYISLLVALSLFLLYQLAIKRYKVQLTKLKDQYDNISLSKNHIDEIVREQLFLTGKTINNWNLINRDGKEVMLTNIISKENCDFFIFTEFSCFDCVEKSLEAVLSTLKDSNSLVLICGNQNLIQVINWANEKNFLGSIYQFNEYKDCIFSRFSNYPYLFKVNDKLQITKLYPLSKNTDYLNTYFDK
jgi:hypothetical protein